MTSLKYGIVTLFLGVSLLGSNIVALNAVGHSSAGSFFGMFGAMMLIFLAVWDFFDHYAELKADID